MERIRRDQGVFETRSANTGEQALATAELGVPEAASTGAGVELTAKPLANRMTTARLGSARDGVH